MGTTYHWPALVTLAALALVFGCVIYVGRMRMRHKVPAPATSRWSPLFVVVMCACLPFSPSTVRGRTAKHVVVVWLRGAG